MGDLPDCACDCTHCDDCDTCNPEPNFEAIAEDIATRNYNRGEAIRWGGLDIPS